MKYLKVLFVVAATFNALFAFQGKYKGAEAITANQLRDYLTFIASDELEGRDTPSRGLNTAAKFIATNLSRWGIKPGGDNGTYFQKIELRRSKIDVAQTCVDINGQKFWHGKDFLGFGADGAATGKLVFVGYGYRIAKKNFNAFEGVDVKGKIIVKYAGRPEFISDADFTGKMGEDWDGATSYGTRNGAVGILLVPDFQSLATWDQTQRTQAGKGSLQVEKFINPSTPSLPTITLSPRAVLALFQGERMDGIRVMNALASGDSIAGFEFSEAKKVSFTFSTTVEKAWTQNVIGILEGSDPSLKKEYLAIGAHYDHVGMGTAMDGDSIWNGADDDGSGTVSVLSIAEALAKGSRPKRSTLFVWHVGEEKGLWGSHYFVNNPTVPIKDIVAQLNIDMVGRSKKDGDADPRNKSLSGPNEVYVIGSQMMSSALGNLSESVNKSFINLKFNYTYDDPNDPNRFFFRSDHFNYAQKGIPIIFYFDGEHEDYHQRGDEVQKIDFEKMQKIARTVYAMAWELAGDMKRPKVDKELPKELKE
jgi:hypothetical protein